MEASGLNDDGNGHCWLDHDGTGLLVYLLEASLVAWLFFAAIQIVKMFQ